MRRVAIVLCTFWIAGGPVCRADDPPPHDQDEFSGKKVTDGEMAVQIVRKRFYNAPRYGEAAPPFELLSVDTGETVALETLHAEKPVVLLFGSYGCDVLRDSADELAAVHEKFREDFHFVMIYIREAHSLDGHHPHLGRAEDPVTPAERARLAKTCRVALDLPFPLLVDSMDDRTATRWGAWPIRVFVVDTEGIVVYSGRPGPWGFRPGGDFQAKSFEDLRPHADRFNQESLEEFLEKFDSR